MAKDPVCGMELTGTRAVAKVRHRKRDYHFCSHHCRDAFAINPDQFLGAPEAPLKPFSATGVPTGSETGYQQSDKQVEGPRTAFVLSGGGSLGSIQVGCLEALIQAGIVPDMIVGSSVGALNGAWLAKSPTLEGIARLKELWLYQRPEQVFSGSYLKKMFRLVMRSDSLYSDIQLRELVCHELESSTFEELTVPLHITSTCLDDGEVGVFSKGPLIPAMLASTAIPGVFPPVEIRGETYCDGAIISDCSVETAWFFGATRVFAVQCPHLSPPKKQGLISVIERAAWALQRRLSRTLFENARRQGPVIVIEPHIEAPNGWQREDFSRTEEMMQKARDWTENALRASGLGSVGVTFGGNGSGQQSGNRPGLVSSEQGY